MIHDFWFSSRRPAFQLILVSHCSLVMVITTKVVVLDKITDWLTQFKCNILLLTVSAFGAKMTNFVSYAFEIWRECSCEWRLPAIKA